MTTKTEIKPSTVKVYELEDYEKLLNGIQVAACMITQSHQIVDEQSVLRRLSALTLNGPSDGNCCSCCGVGPFETRAQQIAHYKHHWHTHNLKRKLFGKESLTLGQFNSRKGDSSVSGSDSESDSTGTKPASDLFAAATRHCKAFFTNKNGKVFCIYRCILHHKKEELSTDGEGIAWVDRCQKLAVPLFQRWGVLMVSGGRFAGAIFAGNVVVLHKTLHSYVTRRGQGHAQVTRDQRSHAPRSAGASLRRYNQAHFLENVQNLMVSWTEDLKGCYLVLYRAVGSVNQAALFGKNSPLKRDDLRVRQLPFPTRKPTYKEVKRVHETVASIEVYETMEVFQRALIASTTKPTTKTNSDTSVEFSKKSQKSPSKPINRAKSRERAPRELPTAILSSEDEGPCFIDSETPVGWIKTLSEQSSNGVITNSRKDLLNDNILKSDNSDSEEDNLEKKEHTLKKKKKKKPEEKNKQPEEKNKQPDEKNKQPDEKNKQPDEKNKQPKKVTVNAVKIPTNVKKMWKLISDEGLTSLETILEGLEEDELQAACNTADPRDGNTALHKAAIASKPTMVTELLSAGSDPCVKNHQQQTPYVVAPQPDTRAAFRFFQAKFPDKYNYNKSQIPGPVTPEQLEQEREKKAQQKRAKRQREKEKQAAKNLTHKFLHMTDAQKVQAAMLRCFLCAENLPKRPFEYEKYKFCSIRCLQNHRNLRPLHKTA